MPIRVYRCPDGHDFEELFLSGAGCPPIALCLEHRKWGARSVAGEVPAAPARGLRRQNEVAERDMRGKRVREVVSGKRRGYSVE